MSIIDQAFHTIFEAIDNIKWNSFRDEWFDDFEREHECYDYYSYYYAENCLYVIKDNIRGEIWLTKAYNPYEAYINYTSMCAETYGGIYRGRDYSAEDYYKDFCCNCCNFEDCDHIPIMEDGSIMGDFRNNCRDFDPAD